MSFVEKKDIYYWSHWFQRNMALYYIKLPQFKHIWIPPTSPSHFQVANIQDDIEHHRIDIKNAVEIKQKIVDSSPDFLFHLAAQPIVGRSYEDPLDTWNTNVIGTVNILDALRYVKNKCTAVIITSDKCYDNVEWEWGYRENDVLGGPDPYSASKGAAEIAIQSYFKSYFKDPSKAIG